MTKANYQSAAGTVG